MSYNRVPLLRECGSLALAVALLAGPAQAQENRAAPQSAGTQARGSDGTTANGAADAERTTDIIVTANRRAERLQEVPIAVTVVDNAQLTRQNVNNVEDLARSAPALTTTGSPGTNALAIRGIGSLSFSRTSEGSVGIVVDGVALANTSVNPPQLFDISRVEVLEGPQGTLFGRNSSAGVLNITTNAPNPSKVEAIGHADIGTRGNYVARAAVNLPLSDNAALRVSGSYARDPRTTHNLFDDTYRHNVGESVRARVLWQPIEKITFNIIGDYTKSQQSGGAFWAVFSSTPGSLLTSRLTACGVNVGPDNVDGCTDGPFKVRNVTYGISAQADMDLGFATLTSISAYRGSRGNNYTDIDSTPVNRLYQQPHTPTDNFSQEVRLASPAGGVLEYVAGIYYFGSKLTSDLYQFGPLFTDLNVIRACPLPAAALCTQNFGQTISTRGEIESYAGFGQATLHASSRLRFILGARIGHEDVSARSFTTPVPGALAPISSVAVSANAADTYFSYRAGAQFDVVRDVMVYGTYTRGYKGPAINDQVSPGVGQVIVQPEIPKAAELGIKSSFANGRASLNVAGFHTKVENFQAQIYNPVNANFVFQNAPAYTSDGVTATLFGRPFRGLTGNVGISYIKTAYGRGYLIADANNAITDAHDHPLGWQWRVTASAEYAARLSDRVDGFLQVDVVHNPVRYADAALSPILRIPQNTIVGGRIGVRFDDERLGVSVFARNLFDTFTPVTKFATPIASLQLDRSSFSQFIGPESRRVIGLSLDARL